MNSITSFIKRYPQGVFWTIAYIISGGGYALSLMYPSDFWPFILWGITLAGGLVTWIADGGTGLRTYLSRMVRFRAGIQWYAIALFTPFVLACIAFGLNIITGAKVSGQLPEIGKVAVLFVLFLLTTAAEEPGFRVFSLPRFMKERSPFTASLIIGVLHAIWHLPLYLGGQQGLVDFLFPLCGAILFTWIFNNTNGSVFLAMLLHASNDVAGRFFGAAFSGAAVTSYFIWLGIVFVVMAVLLRVFTGSELGLKDEV